MTLIVRSDESVSWEGLYARSFNEHIFLIGSVQLLLIDEVHLLGEERVSLSLPWWVHDAPIAPHNGSFP
jgi:hypothetical protein